MITYTLTPTIAFDSVSGKYLISEDSMGISTTGPDIETACLGLIAVANARVPANYQIVISQPQQPAEPYGEPGGL